MLRSHVLQYEATELKEIELLLHSPYHEERLFALLLLVRKFSRGNEKEKEIIYHFYLANTQAINN